MDDVIIDAAYTLNYWNKLIVQAYDDTGKKILEKQFTTPHNIDGHVTWTIPHAVFINSDPQYAAIVLCEGEKASVKFQHA